MNSFPKLDLEILQGLSKIIKEFAENVQPQINRIQENLNPLQQAFGEKGDVDFQMNKFSLNLIMIK